jgi:predicted dehydrogenase
VTVRVGVIGCGYWGPNLVRNLLEVSGAEVVACADSDAGRRTFMQRRFPSLSVRGSASAILDDSDIDAVVVATPMATHVPLAEQALRAGKHVLVEKPLAPRAAEAEGLVRLAVERDRRLMVGHTFLFSGAVHKVRELVQSGALGRIYYFESQRVNLGIFRPDTNVLWDLGPHDVSIMLDCLGQEPASVIAVGAPHLPGSFENTAYVTLKFADGVVGFLHLSWLSPAKFRRLVIAGSERMVVYDDTEPSEKVRVYEHGVSVLDEPIPQPLPEREGETCRATPDTRHPTPDTRPARLTPPVMGRQYVYRTGDISIPRIDTGEPLLGECEEFIRAIECRRPPRSDGVFGVRVVRVLEAMQHSLAAGGAETRVNA